jgi:hypothetical protein
MRVHLPSRKTWSSCRVISSFSSTVTGWVWSNIFCLNMHYVFTSVLLLLFLPIFFLCESFVCFKRTSCLYASNYPINELSPYPSWSSLLNKWINGQSWLWQLRSMTPNMHDNLPVEYSFQFSTTITTLVEIKLEHSEIRVEMPLFPDSYSSCAERCQIVV